MTQAAGEMRMIDVGAKEITLRQARARATLVMERKTLQCIQSGEVPKGDVLAAARLVGIQAAKRCADLLPLCHPLMLDGVVLDFSFEEPPQAGGLLHILADCRLRGRTGAEMEALSAVSVAALTVYDMCKSLDRGMVIREIMLLEKSGGRSGRWCRSGDALAGEQGAPG